MGYSDMRLTTTPSFELTIDGFRASLDQYGLRDLASMLNREVNKIDIAEGKVVATNIKWKLEALQGRKIDAIKAYREQTGVGLKEAKDIVELFCAVFDELSDNVVEYSKSFSYKMPGIPLKNHVNDFLGSVVTAKNRKVSFTKQLSDQEKP